MDTWHLVLFTYLGIAIWTLWTFLKAAEANGQELNDFEYWLRVALSFIWPITFLLCIFWVRGGR